MPELPDVETFKRTVADRCRGRSIDHVTVSDPGILESISAKDLERRLKGARVESAHRHGKHLLLELRDVGVLAMHFGTNGYPQIVHEPAADPPYTRLALVFEAGDRLAYVNPRRLGGVSIAPSIDAFIADRGLGPDALDPRFDEGAFTKLFAGRSRDTKSVLMDQALVAGIGNIYSDEILFQAGIHPGMPANRLDPERVARLYRAMKKTLETAIDCGAGSERAVDRLPKSFLLRQRHAGGHCPTCGTRLSVAKRGGRTSYFCPRCQPK
jgi:formamidopyrimidine-DNA glycosylase